MAIYASLRLPPTPLLFLLLLLLLLLLLPALLLLHLTPLHSGKPQRHGPLLFVSANGEKGVISMR
jgi:hypothetical protein